jgi:hypothetical protein
MTPYRANPTADLEFRARKLSEVRIPELPRDHEHQRALYRLAEEFSQLLQEADYEMVFHAHQEFFFLRNVPNQTECFQYFQKNDSLAVLLRGTIAEGHGIPRFACYRKQRRIDKFKLWHSPHCPDEIEKMNELIGKPCSTYYWNDEDCTKLVLLNIRLSYGDHSPESIVTAVRE